MRHFEFVDQPLHGGGLFHRVEIFTLDVFDQRHDERRVVGHLAYHHRYLGEPGHLRRPPAPLAGDQLVALLDRAHHQRLQQALAADRLRQLGERLLVHSRTGLVAPRANARRFYRGERFARRLIAAEQRVESAP